MTKVIIDRTKWSRGRLTCNALLVDEEMAKPRSWDIGPRPKEGDMCCLGFASLATGLRPEHIKGKPFPMHVGLPVPGLNVFTQDEAPVWRNSNFSDEAGRINDSGNITDEEREAKLIELASQNGFEFQFIN